MENLDPKTGLPDPLAMVELQANQHDAELMQPFEEVAAADNAGEVVFDETAEIAGMLQVAAAMVGPLYPSLGRIYTPETCQRLAGAIVPVMQKYGWSSTGLFEKWGPELALLAVGAPVALETVNAIKADKAAALAAEKAKRDAEKAALTPAQD